MLISLSSTQDIKIFGESSEVLPTITQEQYRQIMLLLNKVKLHPKANLEGNLFCLQSFISSWIIDTSDTDHIASHHLFLTFLPC